MVYMLRTTSFTITHIIGIITMVLFVTQIFFILKKTAKNKHHP
jgi:hypothetical protein